MRPHFVAKTDNVKRFLAGVNTAEQRGSREAGWVLAAGEPGFGKTGALMWWAVQSGAVYLRAKSNWTPAWMLRELLRELGEEPERTVEKMHGQAIGLLRRTPRPLVFDETEHQLKGELKLLETLRDIADFSDTVVVIGGRTEIEPRLRRHPQFTSRVSAIVRFQPLTARDVRVLCDELAEVAVADELAAEIHKQSRGLVRLARNAIAHVERIARKRGGSKPLTLADIGEARLAADFETQARGAGLRTGAA